MENSTSGWWLPRLTVLDVHAGLCPRESPGQRAEPLMSPRQMAQRGKTWRGRTSSPGQTRKDVAQSLWSARQPWKDRARAVFHHLETGGSAAAGRTQGWTESLLGPLAAQGGRLKARVMPKRQSRPGPPGRSSSAAGGHGGPWSQGGWSSAVRPQESAASSGPHFQACKMGWLLQTPSAPWESHWWLSVYMRVWTTGTYLRTHLLSAGPGQTWGPKGAGVQGPLWLPSGATGPFPDCRV